MRQSTRTSARVTGCFYVTRMYVCLRIKIQAPREFSSYIMPRKTYTYTKTTVYLQAINYIVISVLYFSSYKRREIKQRVPFEWE